MASPGTIRPFKWDKYHRRRSAMTAHLVPLDKTFAISSNVEIQLQHQQLKPFVTGLDKSKH
jgi:hypothetical protein